MAFDDNEKDLTDDDNPDCVCTATAYADSQGAYSPGKYYYVWLEMGEFLGIDAPVGTIRLLWEGNEPYTEKVMNRCRIRLIIFTWVMLLMVTR